MHLLKAGGAEIPAIGLGSFGLKDGLCSSIVTRAIEIGYRHVDTAVMYNNEAAIGGGIRAASVPRNNIFLTTKVWPTEIGASSMAQSTQASLKRLGLDYVDLLLIHWPNPDIDLAESIGALNRMRQQGLTRHIGVSNFTRALSEAPLTCNQIEYHPQLNQSRMLERLREDDMAFVSFCPLGRGETMKSAAVTLAAEAHGRTQAQIILRWHVQQPGVAAIPRTSNPARLEENFEIFDFELSQDEMAAISSMRSAGRRICDFEFSPAWDQD